MERKKALAVATAATLALGGGIVAVASLTGTSFLGFGGNASAEGPGSFTPIAAHPAAAAKQRVVVRTRDVYDSFVVDTGIGGYARGTYAATPPAQPPAAVTAPAVEPPRVATPARLDDHESDDHESDDHESDDYESPSTTGSANTSTTLPPGVPDDWPSATPIPPMPPNCYQPQLELNGVWNCQHEDD